MKMITSKLAITAILCATGAQAAEDVVIVYDASGSMWGQIDGISKMEIARDVLGDLVQGWSAETNLGLVAYGHRSQGDCTDIETLVTPQPADKEAFQAQVNAIKPVGKTPISAAIEHAADLLAYRDNPATLVLISDGVETCNADPCALSAQLAKQGVKFTAHVVGFDLQDEAHAGLACIAENTGGVFLPASNATELHDALNQVQAAMAQPDPAPEPVPTLPDVSISGPESVPTGAGFDVEWSPPIHPRDMITILPVGTKEGATGPYRRVGDKTTGQLTAPAEPGLYELRYILNEGAKTLATAPIEVIAPDATISGPETVTTGAAFEIEWGTPIHPRDMITILPVGTKEGATGPYRRVGDKTTGQLTAPAEPGLYELRYILNEGAKTLATAPIEVIAPDATISGPETVTTGAAFEIEWGSPIHPRDMVTILPVGTKEGATGPYRRVGDKTTGQLTAPAEPGLYELRYILNEGAKTLATAPIEVVEAEIGISGPGTARAETEVEVSWSSTIHPRDMIALLPMGAKEGETGQYFRAGDRTQGSLKVPSEPGLYEIRYILNEGLRTLANVPLEVVPANAPMDAGAGLSAPETAAPGASITVSWTGGGSGADQRIALARKDQPEFAWITAQKIAEDKSLTLTMPEEPGLYELRFLDISEQALLGRTVVEVK
ncbi:VWA domain-containing protein [Sulfitobacter sp. Ks41]|uniref:VWA domain-containing protein n=2 Tax=Sulfitobacter TaxID=60136 RepID=UPI0023E29346|nr:VWA domain-containing protein [Sulfitobacter sp. Ks41]MDF3362753.1 VWA domain-containing protein [Sulfitobacter sp. Ks41]